MRINPILLLSTASLLLLAARPAAAADPYTIDPGHSFVVFKVKHFGVGYTWGSFRKISGSLVVDTKKPKRSSIKLSIDAASVFTADKKRDTHLKGGDFLNIAEFPKITFVSTKVKKKGKGAAVTGKLTLHGVSKTITVQMNLVGQGKDPWGNDRIGFEGSFSVKRSDYGIAHMPGGIGEKIHLTVAVEGIKKKK